MKRRRMAEGAKAKAAPIPPVPKAVAKPHPAPKAKAAAAGPDAIRAAVRQKRDWWEWTCLNTTFTFRQRVCAGRSGEPVMSWHATCYRHDASASMRPGNDREHHCNRTLQLFVTDGVDAEQICVRRLKMWCLDCNHHLARDRTAHMSR